MTSAHLRLSRVSTATFVVALLAAAPAGAAAYMKLGDIKGDVSDSRHGGQIQVESWSWGATRAGAGKARPQEFTVTKKTDTSTATGAHGTGGGGGAGKVSVHDISMATATRDGAKGGNVEFEWKVEEGESAPPPPPRGSLAVKVPAGTCKAGARYPTAEFGNNKRIYTMTNVVVARCGAARSADGSIPTETLSLNFDKITWKYTETSR